MKKFLYLILYIFPFVICSCRREPPLHLHEEASNCVMELPAVDIDLDVYWDYELVYGINYDWQAEWHYGWDAVDEEIFGKQGYVEPSEFNIRLYNTGNTPLAPHTKVASYFINGNHLQTNMSFGFWDILAWNDVKTLDGVQSLIFDETESLDYVTAHTNQTMRPSRFNAPKYVNSFYEPEQLFSAYEQGIEIDQAMTGFVYDEERKVWVKTLDMTLEPVTYIYLTQVIIHHNYGRVSAVEGNSDLSGMARSVNLNTGVAGSDAITVNYKVRLKKNIKKLNEDVDIVGGRLLTFGMCNVNANRISRTEELNLKGRNYMSLNMQFNNGIDSTFVFDVTDQVKRRYKGGVITVELDMDTIPIPSRSGGSGFDAVVKDFEEEQYEFDM